MLDACLSGSIIGKTMFHCSVRVTCKNVLVKTWAAKIPLQKTQLQTFSCIYLLLKHVPSKILKSFACKISFKNLPAIIGLQIYLLEKWPEKTLPSKICLQKIA